MKTFVKILLAVATLGVGYLAFRYFTGSKSSVDPRMAPRREGAWTGNTILPKDMSGYGNLIKNIFAPTENSYAGSGDTLVPVRSGGGASLDDPGFAPPTHVEDYVYPQAQAPNI